MHAMDTHEGETQLHSFFSLGTRLTYSDVNALGKEAWTSPKLSIKVYLYAKDFHQFLNGHVLRESLMHHYYNYTTAKASELQRVIRTHDEEFFTNMILNNVYSIQKFIEHVKELSKILNRLKQQIFPPLL
jgi:hypothetical protein